MRESPILTYFLMASVLILSLSYAIRIFERPYFHFNFIDQEGQTFYNFQSLFSTMWFVIITMTSVGYGNIIATTPIGRFFALVTAIVGAFLNSLLVAILTSWFIMEERQANAINKM